MLPQHRDHLQSPATRQRIGFLMSRYSVGVEWWEIVELVRKLILTGVLIYFPTTSRAAAAVIVCVVCVAMLNLFEPHKSRSIFWVCQGSYLITTSKYLVTTFKASNAAQNEMLGGILIFTDVSMYVAGVFCVLLLCRAWVVKRPGKTASASENDGTKDAVESSSTAFVNAPGQFFGQHSRSDAAPALRGGGTALRPPLAGNRSFKSRFRVQVEELRNTMVVSKMKAASAKSLKMHNVEVMKRKSVA